MGRVGALTPDEHQVSEGEEIQQRCRRKQHEAGQTRHERHRPVEYTERKTERVLQDRVVMYVKHYG